MGRYSQAIVFLTNNLGRADLHSRDPVAVRLAGSSDLEDVTAGSRAATANQRKTDADQTKQ
jgi:hypothetical protein